VDFLGIAGKVFVRAFRKSDKEAENFINSTLFNE
jgi:hypothetical protein